MQSAAEQQYQLGDKYYFGEGVTKDLKKAAEYYELAAKQGDKYAKNALIKLQATSSTINANSSTINANLIHIIVEEDSKIVKESTQVAEQPAMFTAERMQLQGEDSQPLLMTAQGRPMVSTSYTFTTPQQLHAEVSELSRGLQHLALEVNPFKDVHAIQSNALATHANVLSKAKKS